MSDKMIARYWEKAEARNVRCLLCPHACHIRPGRTGRCLVRKNIDGQLIANAYGEISSMSIDPIEKKPLKHYYPGSSILSVGSYGCSLSCDFCQNWTIAQREVATSLVEPEQLVRQAADYEHAGNIGLAFTYNEPLINIEYVMDCAQMIRKKGLKTVLITNGYLNSTPFLDLLPYVDAMNIDLKAYSQTFYKDICFGSLKPVIQSIEAASKSQCHVEVTTLIMPGLNDQESQIEALAVWLASLSPEIPLHLTRYFPAYKRADPDPPSLSHMKHLADLARKHLTFVELGNV